MSTISASTTSTTAYKVTADTTGVLTLQTGATPTTAMTIDGSQNVGIGTASPAAKLDVTGTTSFLAPNATNSGGSFRFGYGSGGYAGTMMINADNDTGGAYIAWNTGTKTGNATGTYVVNGYATKIDGQSGILKFLNTTSGTAGADITWSERARIDSSGVLCVGTTGLSNNGSAASFYGGGSAVVRIYGTQQGSGALAIDKLNSTNTTAQQFINFTINNQATGSGQINANGASQAAFGSFSDERLKENIVDLPPQLSNILALRPVEFDYKAGGHQTGFIAQEMQQVFPDAVGEDGSENNYLTVTGWNKTEAILVKAIQELKAELDAAKADIATLKGAA